VELRAGPDTVPSGYAEIQDAVWLGGGRWAVVAPLDVAVGMVDLGSATVTPLGGEGTREIRNPASVFLAGDTLYVSDWGLRRVGLWSRDGRLLRTIPAPATTRGALPSERDASGSWYLELKPAPGPDGSGNRDSAVVVAADPVFRTLDTVAQLAPLDLAEVTGDAGRRFEPRALSGTDRWGALADGSVWVARVSENRVDWRSPDGEWEEGDLLPDRVLEVSQYDLACPPPRITRLASASPAASRWRSESSNARTRPVSVVASCGHAGQGVQAPTFIAPHATHTAAVMR
jgi:hypothetical protein